jgi:urease subunit alpha
MTCEPLVYKPQWGAFGGAKHALSVTFMTGAAIDDGVPDRLGLRSRCVAVRNTRQLTKRDLVLNDALPQISVDPDTYRVEVDGELCTCEPMTTVPLGRLYMLK